MTRTIGVVFWAAVSGACAFAGPIDIGSLSLSGSNQGYQVAGVYNFTGAVQGCGALSSQYNVCNGLNINTWSLTIGYLPQVAGLGNGIGVASTLVFNSGVGDAIAPTDAGFTLYTGTASAPWSLQFDLTNTNCQATCDAYVTTVVFSGTVDQTFLQIGESGSATSTANVPGTFTATLTVPAADYTAAQSTDSISESVDILLDTQAPTSSAPEPVSSGLSLLGLAALAYMKRRTARRT